MIFFGILYYLMLKKIFIVAVVAAIAISISSGCKKDEGQTESDTIVKTAAEYAADAEKTITEKNMDAELEKIEKELEEELSAEGE